MKRHPRARTSDDDERLIVLRGTKRSIALPASEALMRPAGILARAQLDTMIAEREAAKILPAKMGRRRKAGA